ncbi:hypothetical protein O181_099563 [Austropuccinia psidii MF-1]|uniref:Uncharacterized protein n=1 Tax=Austropuccinia psidii MF-1 TaxID=1389203 RepID=A0A9Q3PF93_9BASI|nr:hypothetical protein [Austropuccinia psidii MF-1]
MSLYTSGTLESQGRSQRTDRDCSEQEDQCLDTMVDGRNLRENFPMLLFTVKSNQNPKKDDLKNMDQALQLHKILKDLLQLSMENKRFNQDSNYPELGEGFQEMFPKEIPFNNLVVIAKGWNSNKKFKLLEEGAARIRENQATIQAMEEKLNQKEHNLINSGSQGLNQKDYPLAQTTQAPANKWKRVTILHNSK